LLALKLKIQHNRTLNFKNWKILCFCYSSTNRHEIWHGDAHYRAEIYWW